MTEEITQKRGSFVEDAFHLLQVNRDIQNNIPASLREIITLRVWEGYLWNGKIIQFNTFQEFVEAPPPEGFGTTLDNLVKLCGKYPEIVELIDQTVSEQKQQYQPLNGHRKTKETSMSKSLRRLRRAAETNPEVEAVRQLVLQGKMSTYRAFIELGWRQKRYSVTATPESVFNFASHHLNEKQLLSLIENLKQCVE